ncbi:DNA-3-methyladenine glycosylase 1-like [Macadamia integrifolia]|uniref:DNA-3-methyladenine glycosylase 1-like n=1 Tax=Macadamia integrifolia TaxID=60698 RepID=UPI001C4F05F5|nr:DNA-3-methyladenine glycosylase 1-like [Macadamia integrifolia]XP_042508119.1 DNA-3-methyladenine glycosylase 1-like [Macadamia integrifolia]
MPVRPRKKKKVSADVSTDNSQNKAPQAVDRDSTTSNAAAAAAATVISEMVTATTVVHNGNAIRVIPTIVSRKLSCEGEVSVAIRHLKAADPLLARVIDAHQSPSFDTSQPPFFALTKSILYQQLADKAATSIYTRFVSLCGGEAGVVPDAVLSFSVPQLREIGVSARKASYIHDLASKYHKGILSDASIIDMEVEALFEMLTMVNGIGPWTVHMFMIFSLHRPDVLPIGDLGVRKGVQFLYGLKQLPRPNQMEKLCEKWIPYRSLGAWYMWRLAGAKGTQASAAATTHSRSNIKV